MIKYDCIIIGGGPAGLMAGIYLTRYRRKIIIFDTFESRVSLIPLSHNYPGAAKGISGKKILKSLQLQAKAFGISIKNESVMSITKQGLNNFLVKTDKNEASAKSVLIATGVKDIEPNLPELVDGIKKGLIRHCPVCDAFEVINKKIAVIGSDEHAFNEALFLSHYSKHVTLITLGNNYKWRQTQLEKIKKSNIKIITKPLLKIKLLPSSCILTFIDNKISSFDTLYSALGSVKNNSCYLDLNLKEKDGCLVVNKNQETSTKGIFAAGDITSGLNQIVVAFSQAAIAANNIHFQLSSLLD